MRRVVLLPFALVLGCAPATQADKSADQEATRPPLSGDNTATGADPDSTATTAPPPPPPPPPPPKVEAEADAEPIRIDLVVGRPKSKLKVADKKHKSAKPAEDPAPGSSEPTPQAASTEEPQGRLKREQVQEVLAKHRDDFRPCIREDSVVRIDATITTSGAVAEAKSDKSDPDDTKLRECVVAAFSKLTFPTDWAQAGTQDGTRLSLELRLRKEDS